MRAVFSFLVTTAVIAGYSGIASGQGVLFEASAAAIDEVISGKTCVGQDVLKFGEHNAQTSGHYERNGRPPGLYETGYGTILIKRGKDLHSHVATVSVEDHTLYMSADKYLCGP